MVLATPVLAAGLAMNLLDRNFGTNFFDPANGGNAMLWQNVFWFYSHPAVYIMILPALGIISEVLPVFSRKPLFGYKAMAATMRPSACSASPSGPTTCSRRVPVVLPFFAFMTFLIAVPTGVKMFNWLATMWRGSIRFATPMLFALGFLADVPDRRHRRRLLGAVAGRPRSSTTPTGSSRTSTTCCSAAACSGSWPAFYYWFPKMTGRMLNETLGKIQFWTMFIGFNLTFFPMHILGLDGMPRRIATYARRPGWSDINSLVTSAPS